MKPDFEGAFTPIILSKQKAVNAYSSPPAKSKQLTQHEMVLAPEGRRMSRSKKHKQKYTDTQVIRSLLNRQKGHNPKASSFYQHVKGLKNNRKAVSFS